MGIYTFLDVMNATLKRTGDIQGDAGELATSTVTTTTTATGAVVAAVATEAFTDSSRQRSIDVGIQIWNETIHEVYNMGLFAKEAATATISIVANQREYDLPTDFERMAGEDYGVRVIRGVTCGLLLYEYPGGYAKMLADQITASDYQGDTQYYAMSPADSKIRLGAEPTSAQASRTFNYLYEKRVNLTSTQATQTLPFSDTVADALVPVVAEYHGRTFDKDYDKGVFIKNLSRAVATVRQMQPNRRWGTR